MNHVELGLGSGNGGGAEKRGKGLQESKVNCSVTKLEYSNGCKAVYLTLAAFS